MLAALRCPECTAPVPVLPAVGEQTKCTYCGAAITIVTSAAGRTEEHFSIVLRVGPSNVDRVARFLHDHARIDIDDARARLEQPRCEIEIGPHEVHAHEMARAAVEAGALADVVSRTVAIPLRTVTLDDAGANKLAVIVALRAEVDLTVPEAKRLVGGTPCMIVANVEEPIARALVAALEAAGAKASAR